MNSSKYEYIPVSPLSSDSQSPETSSVGMIRRENTVVLVTDVSGQSDHYFRNLQKKLYGITSLMTQLGRLQSPPPLSLFSASVSGGSRSLINVWRILYVSILLSVDRMQLSKMVSVVSSKSSIFSKRGFAIRRPLRELDSTSRTVFFTLQSSSSSLSRVSRPFAPDFGTTTLSTVQIHFSSKLNLDALSAPTSSASSTSRFGRRPHD